MALALNATAAEVAALKIRMLIANGHLNAGEVLREEDLSARTGVSRTPVREAIARLKAEGLVTTDRSRSAVVFKPSVADLREIYEMRIALESLASRLAADVATGVGIERLEELHRQLDDAPPGRPWVRLNREFHLAYYEMAGRPRLYGLIENLRAQSEPYVQLLVTLGHGDEAQEGHRELIEAARARDGDAAADACTRHLSLTVTQVMSELEGREG
ncbi:MAG: GntR family transcriptional regulator [Nitriliruptorales bacterium]